MKDKRQRLALAWPYWDPALTNLFHQPFSSTSKFSVAPFVPLNNPPRPPAILLPTAPVIPSSSFQDLNNIEGAKPNLFSPSTLQDPLIALTESRTRKLHPTPEYLLAPSFLTSHLPLDYLSNIQHRLSPTFTVSHHPTQDSFSRIGEILPLPLPTTTSGFLNKASTASDSLLSSVTTTSHTNRSCKTLLDLYGNTESNSCEKKT